MTFIKKTWDRMVHTIIVLLFIIYCGSVYMAWQNGSIRGYELGKMRATVDSQFNPYVESKKTFCYDEGIIYTVRKGKKSFIPEFK